MYSYLLDGLIEDFTNTTIIKNIIIGISLMYRKLTVFSFF